MNGISSIDLDGYDEEAGERGGVGEVARPPPLRTGPLGPRPAALVEGYRHDAANNFPPDKPRYNPLNPERVQTSMLVDLKDPVQVHLLTETALFDSKEYEILSQEEVDKLKKQCQLLHQRIDQTKSNLAIQSKYRDAAISMTKLYSPTPGRRRSLLSSRGGSDAAREAEAERDIIQRKCEDLATELWFLEKRLMDPQRRLLEHTAGILQMTHKTTKKAMTPASRPAHVNGIPASPESMYTTSNGRDSLDVADDFFIFDQTSLYRSFDDLSFGGPTKKSPLEIPLKSPVREQQKQLTEESEKLRTENAQLKEDTQALSFELDNLRNHGSDMQRMISDTETRLAMLNYQLREVIVSADPAQDQTYDYPPDGQAEPGDMIDGHMAFLEGAIATVGETTNSSSPQVTDAIQAINVQIQDMLLSDGVVNRPSPPQLDADINDHLAYLRNSMEAIGATIQRTMAMSSKGSVMKQEGEQIEAVLMGLWEIIVSGDADIRQRKLDRRQTRLDKGLGADDDDMSDVEPSDPNEKYSLSAFSTKVQWLYAQATSLRDQKSVLNRQIKQQRDLNSKSDKERDDALGSKDAEIQQIQVLLSRTEKELENVQKQLLQSLQEAETIQNNVSSSSTDQAAAIEEATAKLRERNDKIAALEVSSQEVQRRLEAAETSIAAITNQLQEANNAKSEADKQIADMTQQIKSKEDELDQMTGMVADLKMEATLAKAELDGAYGSRKERAAEAAALASTSELSQLQAQVERLQPLVEELQTELQATAKDLKDMTKQSLDAESRIADLESELDKVQDTARKEKEELQEALDKERFNGTAGGPLSPSGRGNTSILTNSYRDALRAERKKYEEQLRNEQMTRRKAEEELRLLKRGQGPGKSVLSPRAS